MQVMIVGNPHQREFVVLLSSGDIIYEPSEVILFSSIPIDFEGIGL